MPVLRREQHHRLGQQRNTTQPAERFMAPEVVFAGDREVRLALPQLPQCVGATELTNLHTDLGVHLRRRTVIGAASNRIPRLNDATISRPEVRSAVEATALSASSTAPSTRRACSASTSLPR